MGECMSSSATHHEEQRTYAIEDIDIVKVKLKTARDKINNLINAKNKDISIINAKIIEQIPHFQQTGNKKSLLPLLQSKKNLNTFVNNADIRLKLINDKLHEVEMQKINVDTINALDDANKYIKIFEKDLEQKDWRTILEESKRKCEIDWPQDEENIENDPKFIALWEELGGNKIPSQKSVNVIIPQHQQVQHNQSQQNQQIKNKYNQNLIIN